MEEKTLSWQASDSGATKKTSAWYWSVGILGGGVAVASFIAGNVLFGLFAVLGSFAIMLAGSRPATKRIYEISDKGFRIGPDIIPFKNISRFAIREEEPRKVVLETTGLIGTVSVLLAETDFRTVRSELKNRNVEEVDSLDSLTEKIVEVVGM